MSEQNQQACDLVIEARWVLPIAPANEPLEDHAVAVRGSEIVAVAPQEEVRAQYNPVRTVRSAHGVLTPGLINTHTHAAMTLLRGTGEDLPLQAWLTERIWPLEGQLVDTEFVRVGTELAAMEMIRGGTTFFSDMYFFPETVAEVAVHARMRTQLAFPIFDGKTAWASGVDACFSQGLALHDQYRDDPHVHVAFGPHAPYTVSRKTLERVLTLSEEIHLGVHIHLHENAAEVAEARAEHGDTWVRMLAQMGLLNPALQATHMTQLTPEEIELVATHGAHVIHCPLSNLKLASGVCPTHELSNAGVGIGLGTDGAAANNGLDLLAEARQASLLAKNQSGQADAGNVRTALEMATLGGARAMGLDASLGSIEPGKWADLALFEPTTVAAELALDPFASLVHSPNHNQATHVWVGGELLLEAGRHTTVDLEALRRDTTQQMGRVQTELANL